MTKSPPPPKTSALKLVRIAPADTALFRFLLESYENLAYFSALEPKTALLKVVYSPHQERCMRRALNEMAQSIHFTVEEWPLSRCPSHKTL